MNKRLFAKGYTFSINGLRLIQGPDIRKRLNKSFTSNGTRVIIQHGNVDRR